MMSRIVRALEQPKWLTQLSLGLTVLTFLLIFLGGLTRAYGAGLACPDWPKCFGQWIPPMNSLVFLEWFHRLAAATVSTIFLVLTGWVLLVPAFRARYGAILGTSVLLIFVQIILGKLTVEKLLKPEWVFLHLGTALAFYGCLLVTTLQMQRHQQPTPDGPMGGRPAIPAGVWTLSLLSVIAVYGQALLGVAVSSHYAALACPDWPLCNGMLFPPMGGAVGLQVIHRFGAYTVAGLVLALMLIARQSADPRIRRGTALAFGLVLAQITLGVVNVFLLIPPFLSGLHLATAVALWTTLITVTLTAQGQRRTQPTLTGIPMVPAQ
ncbi:MAG: COX15/CtaA family protein [Candidatus Sericytochromatia bacterium]|nr:COX15/CtaA family protein [Candidatus Sericytochromatia bacterium]